MASALKTLLWAWVISKSVVSLVTLPEITDEAFIDECVRGHNQARSSVAPAASDMLRMVGLTHSFISLAKNADRQAKSKLRPTKVLVLIIVEETQVAHANFGLHLI